jgi:hypothetical protein
MHPHLSGNMSRYHVPVFQFHPEHRITEGLDHSAILLN